MLDRITQLSKQAGVTVYLCNPQTKTMVTIHDGKKFDGEIPQWMLNFIEGGKSLLSFEQEGQRKSYFSIKLTGGQFLVFLDDAVFTSLSKLVNKALEPQVGSSAELFINQALETKVAFEAEKKRRERDLAELEQMKDVIDGLKAQNVDQAVRLKDVLSQNLSFANEIKQLKAEDIKSDGLKLRGTVTLLRDENTRLTLQIKQWEEKYRKLQDRCDELLKSRPTTQQEAAQPAQNTSKGGLFNVVNALNRVIETGNASGINIEALSMIIPISSRAELERSPNTVKALIAKLLGMERSGQLSALQLKKIKDAVGE